MSVERRTIEHTRDDILTVVMLFEVIGKAPNIVNTLAVVPFIDAFLRLYNEPSVDALERAEKNEATTYDYAVLIASSITLENAEDPEFLTTLKQLASIADVFASPIIKDPELLFSHARGMLSRARSLSN